jgi:electron transfer flavoprotein beta subunit
MKIGVCVKRVPDTETRVKVGPDGKHIDETGVQWVVNPYDEIAVEQALQIKEAQGQGEVVVVSLGPAGTTEPVMRKALAMGADRGVFIKESQPDRDRLSTAKELARVIQEEKFDLVFCGRQAVDDDSCQVGPMLGQLLGWPAVSDVSKFQIEGTRVTVHKEVEGGEEKVEVELPALLTCQKGLVEPRLPALKGIMAAKKKPLATKDAEGAEPLVTILKMDYPPSRPPGKVVGQGKEAVPTLISSLKNEAKVL